ncbi:MAG: hypothetical protein HND53_13280 [Proteobacteria bacterium]|nr:hypothetical protein [Pseudomonadota bacterium]NOG61469.1 hypothetical protein [Pseudomonadota bacterium]
MKKLLSSLLLLSVSFTLNAAPVIEKAWETAAEFKLPESVIYDDSNNVLYVSNMQDSPFTKDGNGFISKIGTDGTIIELEWVTGLNAPKGLTISDGNLYIADVDQLIVVEIATGKILSSHHAFGAGFLNDVTADAIGNVYVSDMFNDTIYRLNKLGQLTVWLYSPDLLSPNGLHVEGNELIVGCWGFPMDGFATEEPGHLKTVSLATKEIKSLGNGKPVGNLDGVEPDGKDAYYATDWVAGKLLHIKKDGSFEVLLELTQGTADHEVILKDKLIVIPNMVEGKVLGFNIK